MIIKFRKAKIQDIPKICEIHKRCASFTNSKFYPGNVIKEWLKQISNKNIKNQFSNSSWFVALLDNIIIGFAQVSFNEKVLFQLNIDPKFQGKGYGKRFYDFIENEFRKKRIEVIFLQSTKNALLFYRNLGFLKIKKVSVGVGNTSMEMIAMKKVINKN